MLGLGNNIMLGEWLPVDQVYVAPEVIFVLAVKVINLPEQIDALPVFVVIERVGDDNGTTTVTLSLPIHPFAETVKVYWVVAVGEAIGLQMLGSLNPMVGSH